MTESLTLIRPPSPHVNVDPSPGAAPGTSSHKSGYAKDVRPESMSSDELAGNSAPVASASGRQEGHVPAADRKTGHYEAVTAEEADSRMRARRKGDAALIKDGLDGPGRSKSEVQQYDDSRMEFHDSQDAIPEEHGSGAVTLLQAAKLLQKVLAKPDGMGVAAEVVGIVPSGEVVERAPSQPYLDQRTRIQLQIEGAGTYSIPAIDVIEAGLGILVILPADASDATFVPNPGTEVVVTYHGAKYTCFYPGIVGEIPQLKAMVIAMVNKEATL